MKAGFLSGKLSTRQVILHADELFHEVRWPNGIVYCPYCGEVHKIYTCKNGYKCGNCAHKFTDRTKTLLHSSKLSTTIWMQAIYEVFTDNFISSTQLAIKLHINQKSAWLLLSKLRLGLLQDDYLLNGIIAHDEMHIGGSLSNFHYSRKWALLRKGHYIIGNEKRYTKEALFSLNSDLKQPVFGLNDGNQIILYALPEKKKEYLHQIYRMHVAVGSESVCDESSLYYGWEKATGCKIHVNNHSKNQYKTEDGFTSNRIENTFSWYKRGFGATITHCKYHQLYLNEFVFRYNTRSVTHEERFRIALKHTIGKTYTYKDIKGQKQMFGPKTKKGHTEEEIKEMLSTGLFSKIKDNNRIYTSESFK